MSLRERTRPGVGTIEPCLPSPAQVPPRGPGWLHEIKHDGFRILARRDSAGVRLITRAGNDFSSRFPFIAMAVAKLSVRSCLIDGEAVVCDQTGLAVFDLIRGHRTHASAVHVAFDVLELNGKDLRRQPIEIRKDLLARLLKGSHLSIVLNEHFEDDGAAVYRAACRLAVRGLCQSALAPPIARGRSPHWVKIKNPNAPAVKREAEEDWGSSRWIKKPQADSGDARGVLGQVLKSSARFHRRSFDSLTRRKHGTVRRSARLMADEGILRAERPSQGWHLATPHHAWRRAKCRGHRPPLHCR